MTELEVDISRATKAFALLESTIDSLCRAQGLTVTMKASQAKYPGSIHWHVKKGRDRGTLEVTLWPEKKRLWFSMQDGRKGDWVLDTAGVMKRELEARSR